MEQTNERMQILEMIDNGTISADEGMKLLQALSDNNDSAQSELQKHRMESDLTSISSIPEKPKEQNFRSPYMDLSEVSEKTRDPQERINLEGVKKNHRSSFCIRKWNNWWLIPFGIGTGITTLGAALLYWATQASAYVFWLIIIGLIIALGLIIMFLSWFSRSSPWLHLRVRQRPGRVPQNIAFSIPIPLRPIIWFMRSFGRYVPEVDRTSVGEFLDALNGTISADNPISIQVGNGEFGERVELYIG